MQDANDAFPEFPLQEEPIDLSIPKTVLSSPSYLEMALTQAAFRASVIRSPPGRCTSPYLPPTPESLSPSTSPQDNRQTLKAIPDESIARRALSFMEEEGRPEDPATGLKTECVCSECGKRYSNPSNLLRHQQIHRSSDDSQTRECPQCHKTYVSLPAYSMHLRTHTQGCECPHCHKRFSRPWLLQGHIRTHTGEKPFSCSQCSKAFADKSNLRAHIQTHSTAKPFRCLRCGKAFALKSYLYKHEESSCMKFTRPNSSKKSCKKEVNVASS
ncbi:unnamed protein product [Cyprideis torosa]|uniref:Uncharacterized protein n=1 Tax=Cyprideis torosa TaxID=163714 RepID=A0A7R8ZGY2_9CRUS|nr:unnamed protein product [Cyprideis torosa]CAG0881339.1 unnamed protein product [Cyprideis torosa]